MKYLEAIFYVWFGGAVLLLLFKLCAVYPQLAALLGVVVAYATWELSRGPRA